MGGFPQLPSGNNPYAATAAGYASSASSVFNAIRSAAAQKEQFAYRQKQDQVAKDHQDQQDRFQALQDGLIPVDGPGDQGNSPGYVTRDPGAPAGTPGNVMPVLRGEPSHYQTDPNAPGTTSNGPSGPFAAPQAAPSGRDPNRMVQRGGQWFYKQTPEEADAAKLNDTNSMPLNDGLRADLERYNIKFPAGTTRVPLSLIDKAHTAAETHRLEHPEEEPEVWNQYDDKNYVRAGTGERVNVVKSNRGNIKEAVVQQGAPQQGGGRAGGAFDGRASAAPVPAGQSPYSMLDFLTKQPPGPPAEVLNGLPPGDHTFENGQTWRRNHDGTVEDRTAPAGGDASGGLKFSPPDKPDKPDVSQIIPGQQGPNGGMLIYDKNDQAVKEIPLPKGSKGVLTAAQAEADKDRHIREREIDESAATRKTEADQRRADRQQALEDKDAKYHESEGQTKRAMQSMADGHRDAAGTQPGKPYTLPKYVNGIVVDGKTELMPEDKNELAAKRLDLLKLANGFQSSANKHQAEQERVEKAHGWGKFAAAPSGQGSGTSGQSAAAAQPVAPGRGGRGGGAAPVTPAAPVAKVAPAAAAPAKTAAPAIAEGTIIRNPQTGARQILRGGQWKPL